MSFPRVKVPPLKNARPEILEEFRHFRGFGDFRGKSHPWTNTSVGGNF